MVYLSSQFVVQSYFYYTYMGHFINNAQGGKIAEWMMQSQ